MGQDEERTKLPFALGTPTENELLVRLYNLVDLIPIPQCLWGRTPERRLFGRKDQKQMVNRREDTHACTKQKHRRQLARRPRPAGGQLRVHGSPCCRRRRQNPQPGPARLRPEAWSPWPLDPSCGVPSPTTTLTGALGENPAAAPRRLAPIRGGSLAQEANPGRRGRRPERALPFFFFSSPSARKRSLEATSPLPEADRGAFHWIPVWGNPKRETTRPEDGDAESGLGRSCAPLSCPH